MPKDLEKADSFFTIWFPPINLWNHPYQHRFDKTILLGKDMSESSDLERQLNLFENWVQNQTIFNPDLLIAISKPDDNVLFYPVPTPQSKGLFVAFEPVTDRHLLAQLKARGYAVARCRTWGTAREAILRHTDVLL